MKSSIQNGLLRTTLGLVLASSVACSNSGKGDSQDGSSGVKAGPAMGADVTKPSRIIITPKSEWSELKGYIVGRSESTQLVTIADQAGKVGFPNLSSGRYDVVLEGKSRDADGQVMAVALRISGIELGESSDAQIRDIDLKPYVKLEGKALLDGDTEKASMAGITISLPGTPYSVSSEADGSYAFPAIPEGTHDVEMSFDGHQKAYFLPKSYRANERLATLALASEAERLELGAHYLGAPVEVGKAQKIHIQLRAPSSMNAFRYALAGETIEERPWMVLQSSLELDLPAGDKPEVRVQYALDERQLSSVYTVTIPAE